MNQPLHILIVEDSEDDAALLLIALRQAGVEIKGYLLVDNAVAMRAALELQDWDVITSDNNMPRFSALAALALAKELRPDVPFIIVSGEIDLNLAISLMQGGAYDYVQKRDIVYLAPTIEQQLRVVEKHHARQLAKDALEVPETRFRRLMPSSEKNRDF
jgi:DNA-binding NtrC family response regulator